MADMAARRAKAPKRTDKIGGFVELYADRSLEDGSKTNATFDFGATYLATANLQLDLHALGYAPLGIDLSPYMGRIATRKLTTRQLSPRLIRARAQALPFAAESIQTVVCTFPTDFIIDPRTIAEIYRILVPGGRLVFVPNGTLTGGGVAKDGLELAYRATGQRQAWPAGIVERFTNAGFAFQNLVEPGQRSVAHVCIADKPA